MSTIKSSNEHLTLNADGSGKDIKFQSNGSQVASISDGGVVTATTFTGAATDATKLPLAGGTMTGNIAHAGDFTIDVGGDIFLDADGGDINFKDGGTSVFHISNDNSGDVHLEAQVLNKDIYIRGNDGGSTINAVYFDMSDAGFATFNNGITVSGNVFVPDNKKINFGAGNDLQIYHDGSNSYITDAGTGDIHIRSDAGFRVQNAGGTENYIYAEANGKVRLYHNNSTKLDTTATGITVTGAIAGATNLGKVLQVLHYSNGSLVTFPQNSSNNTTIISGAITPSASNSKILTIQYLDLGLQGGNYPALHSKLDRSGATLTSGNLHGYMDTQNFDRRFAYTKIHLDSPNTTSATTYTVYGGNTSGSGFTGTYNGRANLSAPSTLTLIEIGA